MKRVFAGRMVLGAVVTLAAFMSESVLASGWGHSHQRCQTSVISKTVAGPADYHSVYSKIQNTRMSIQGYDLRLNDGQVLHIDTDVQEIDLQALQGLGRGLIIDLTNVEFPGGATSIDVVEIETNVVKKNGAQAISVDGSTCDLSVPRRLNFYTSAAVSMGRESYIVKSGVLASEFHSDRRDQDREADNVLHRRRALQGSGQER
ncbi:MAG: hypothetical protein HC902_12050 [Calothrix sp. SM1_5_4]|nr:hypothetical protein [Calothrix sp. SM1_5_4]